MQIKVEKDYLVIDGKPRFIYGGDFSYGRTKRRCWRERIAKMKATGMNTVTFYTPWIFHEPNEGVWDFKGDHDLAHFIDLIAEAGMFAIFRMGPFVHGEYRNGGLPQWLVDKLGSRVRTNDPEYLELTGRWYEKQLEIVLPRLVTRGGPIILVQLENELGSAGCKGDDIARGAVGAEENVKHVLHYYKLIRSHGVDIPIVDINKIPDKGTLMDGLVDSGGGYPVNCFGSDGELWPFSTGWWDKHERPKVTVETGCCMFARFYDVPAYRNTNGFQGPIIEPEIVEAFVQQNIAEGCNGVNVFVFNDGQHYGPYNESMTAEANMNYQAPVTAVGTLRDSYKALKRIGWFVRAFEQDLLRSQPNPGWAKAASYGIPHPGVELGGDLFEGYEKEKESSSHLAHVKKVEALGRSTTGLNLSESNFFFMRNVKNHGTHWLRDVRVLTNSAKLACEVHQEYPKRVQMELPPGTTKIMPFFVRVAPKTFLEYSTATLLDRRQFGDSVQVIAFATPDETIETRFAVPAHGDVKCSEGMLAIWESPTTVTVIGTPCSEIRVATIPSPVPVRYVLMDQKLAGEVWDVESPSGALVAASNLNILSSSCDGKISTVNYESSESEFHLYLLSPKCPEISGDFANFNGQYDAENGIYRGFGKLKTPVPAIDFVRRKNGSQLILEAEVNPGMLKGCEELILHCEFDGSYGKAFLDDKLISDHSFGKFLFWEIGLRDCLEKPSKLRIVCDDCRQAEVRVKPVVSGKFTINWR
jgi:hypothetical protein